MESFRFRNFDDKDYLKLNVNSETKSLIQKIRKDARDSPYLTNDLSEFLIEHFSYLQSNSEEETIKSLILGSTRYFGKGNAEEIYKSLMSKLNERRR